MADILSLYGLKNTDPNEKGEWHELKVENSFYGYAENVITMHAKVGPEMIKKLSLFFAQAANKMEE